MFKVPCLTPTHHPKQARPLSCNCHRHPLLPGHGLKSVGRYFSGAHGGGVLPGTGSAEAFYDFWSLPTTLPVSRQTRHTWSSPVPCHLSSFPEDRDVFGSISDTVGPFRGSSFRFQFGNPLSTFGSPATQCEDVSRQQSNG